MGFLDRLKQAARRLKTEISVLGVVYRDPRTPWYAKAVIFLVIAQSLSPIDIIPDFVPILGYLDDLVLIPLGIALAIKLVPKEVFAEARVRVANKPEEMGISGWWFGVLIIVLWVVVIGWLVWNFWFKPK
jgi:uncharacterized membrane protein YkvA (DUF1232 family)